MFNCCLCVSVAVVFYMPSYRCCFSVFIIFYEFCPASIHSSNYMVGRSVTHPSNRSSFFFINSISIQAGRGLPPVLIRISYCWFGYVCCQRWRYSLFWSDGWMAKGGWGGNTTRWICIRSWRSRWKQIEKQFYSRCS